MGDLNLDYDNPEIDRERIDQQLKDINKNEDIKEEKVHVYFPFLDIHPKKTKVFKTAARQKETYDQIGIFCRDKRLPHYEEKDDGRGIPPEIN